MNDLATRMARVEALQRATCPTCRMPDGSLNVEWAKRESSCATGCGSVIPWGEAGAGFCGNCRDHSANEVTCETCGQLYQDWENGLWAPA